MEGKFEITNLDMKMGMTMKIKGKIQEGIASFAINLGYGEDVVNLHFEPRFDRGVIVCNSKDGGNWGEEQVTNRLPFSAGSEVTFTIIFENNYFKVTLPDGYVISFPNRLSQQQLHYLFANSFSVSTFNLE